MSTKRAPSPGLLRTLWSINQPYCSIEPSTRSQLSRKCHQTRRLQTRGHTANVNTPIPLRKKLKEEAKARNSSPKTQNTANAVPRSSNAELSRWELTVGIEIHAELNAACKLFSPAQTSLSDTPNSHVSMFDVAIPGAQPQFQKETLLPALRAAIALGCKINRRSGWDRKHYFWWDQPNGYQITQYYGMSVRQLCRRSWKQSLGTAWH